MRRFLALSCICVLAACVPSGDRLVALKEKQISASNFDGALALEYLAYAQSLSEQQHPMRADYFAGKGLKALEGKEVLPESAADSQLQARVALMDVLTNDMKDIVPVRAARAQLLFDCWVDEAKRVFDSTPTLCEESFAEVLAELQSVGEILVHGDDNQYEIRFTPDSYQLSEQAETMLDVVAKHVNGLGRYRVEILADTGARASSKAKLLTKNRTLAIEKGLIARGVNAGHIVAHRRKADKAVLLSVDMSSGAQDNVTVMIQTFEQPEK